MSEVEKHRLVFDRPHIYKCKCGMVHMIFISEFKVEEKTLEFPEHVEYMSCGHATCARREDGTCIICLNCSLTKRALDAANVCRVINHFYVDGVCSQCGSIEPPRQ